MPIKNLPKITIPKNNSVLLEILDKAAQAAEIAELIAPYINRPVSWRTISSAAFDAVNFLSNEGLISDELTSALNSSISEMNQIQNTANSLRSATQNLTSGNFQESLYAINNITATLDSQSSSLST